MPPLTYRSGYGLATLIFVAVVAVPLTTSAYIRLQSAPVKTFRQEVSQDRARFRAQRRLYARAVKDCKHDRDLASKNAVCRVYWEALDRCMTRKSELIPDDINRPDLYGNHAIGIGCPDINDQKLLADLYNISDNNLIPTDEPANFIEDPSEQPKAAAPDLSSRDRLLLRRYTHARKCPPTLADYLPGFYELCLSLVGEGVSSDPIRGITKDRSRHAAPVMPTLRLRRQQWAEEGKARPDR
jgi:hypothetical protein